jgi:tetratricopeptide (TPR) repeat protein
MKAICLQIIFLLFFISTAFLSCKTNHDCTMKSNQDTILCDNRKSQELVEEAVNLQREIGFTIKSKEDSLIFLHSANLLKQAIEVDSMNLFAYVHLVQIYLQFNNTNEAIKLLEKTLIINPNYVEAMSSLGFLHEKIENYDKAVYYYHSALKEYNSRTEKTYSDCINKMFLLLMIEGEETALKELQTIKQMFPDQNPENWKEFITEFNRKEFIENALK